MCVRERAGGGLGGGKQVCEREVREAYAGKKLFCHIPAKQHQRGGQEHMAKCFPSWLR